MTTRIPAHAPARRRAPQQARAIASCAAILDATALVLQQRGLAGLTTNHVAERAGVGIATLYAYFPDKYALVAGLAQRILAEDRAVMLAALDAAEPADPVERLVGALIDNHCRAPAVRRIALSALIGAGGGDEIARHAEDIVRAIAAHRAAIGGSGLDLADPARLFVVTRAVLGVARALTNEPAIAPPRDVVHRELVRLVRSLA